MFRPVGSKTNFPEIEERVLGFWQEKKIFEKSVEQRKGKPSFILFDGPPTVNGNPALHHVLTSVFKDVIPRYKAMKGFYAPRIAGWDTHGLPVELEIEKKLGFTSKTQIEEYGIAKFNELCRQSVSGYISEFEKMVRRAGYWIDTDNAYITMRNEYIESCWWAIKQMWDKGLVFQGFRVTPHCPRCGTSLSSHEVALGYQDNVEDTSVFIRFRLSSNQPEEAKKLLEKLGFDSKKKRWKGEAPAFLAWTTTPWTLTANVALAVAPDSEYVLVQTDAGRITENLIMAKALLNHVLGPGNGQILEEFEGKDLAGMLYERIYEPKADQVVDKQGWGEQNRVVAADFVSMEDGSGIVHIAPAYGEEDYDLGRKENLPLVHTVDLSGNMLPNGKPWDGKFVKKADPLIVEDLNARGILFRAEKIKHTYPFCWRCGTPLVYYAKRSWYIKTTTVKNRLIEGNNQINWYPEHIKFGRFGDWLNNNVDWAFSRERYWGTTLPVWRCESCGELECVGGIQELKEKPGVSGLKEQLDLHRPYVDDISFSCSKCGGKMKRVPEVIDCWFDSGAMPVAQVHYPFENKAAFEKQLNTADYICEAVDQTRGWFYSLHAISTLLFDRPSFKNVICLGLILDAKGEKMSKSKGNVVWPGQVIDKYGADALRWDFFTSCPPGNVRRFDEKMLAEVTRRFLLTLWNVYSFFVLYANIDNYDPGKPATSPEQAELDRWIISELNQLIMDVDSNLENYNPTDAGRKIETFVDELSNWYVRRSRRRFWKSENDTDKLSAYNTLYHCLVTLSKLLAPFTPFIAEELYRNLVCSINPDAPESVHLTDFPVADKSKIDEQLGNDIKLAMKISSLGRAARSQAAIKVRQPLEKVTISVASPGEQRSLVRTKPQVLEELNVKDFEFTDDAGKFTGNNYVACSEGSYAVIVSKEISPELIAEGMAREIVHRLQTMRRSAGFEIADYISTYYEGDDYIKKVMTDFADYIKQETLSRQIVSGVPAQEVYAEEFKLSGYKLKLGVKKEG